MSISAMVQPMLPNALETSIILVEPRTPGNIGMVCRAMANFGLSDLRLVNPCPYLHPEAHKFAVFASDLLGQARVFPSLQEAIADRHLTFAATRRSGRTRGEPLSVRKIPEMIGKSLPAGGVGIVFGREDAGLTNEEVHLCSFSAVIPTASETGSLNLAQAVLIFLYELGVAEAVDEPIAVPEEAVPTSGEMEALFGRMEETLSRIAFLNPAKPEARMQQLRRILRRAAPNADELALLRGMWEQIDWSVNEWRQRRRGQKEQKT